MHDQTTGRDQSPARSLVGGVVTVLLSMLVVATLSTPTIKAAGSGLDVPDAYTPAGYMGDTDRIGMDGAYSGVFHAPATSSIRVTSQPRPQSYAGVYFLRVSGRSPQGNWGDEPGLDLHWATKLTFWAKGEHGGELVEFKAGGVRDSAKPYKDSFVADLGTVSLTANWQQYTIDLAGLNMTSVLGAFAWIAKGADNPGGLTFYLSELTYVGPVPDWAPIVTPTHTPTSTPYTRISDGAYSLLIDRVAANRQHMFLYQDSDSALNHGFPSGWFGKFDKITMDDACIDDPSSQTGCSTDVTRLDRRRGTVMNISFKPLLPGEFAGVNIEEPEHWGVTQVGRGYDLRGATTIVFDVRSPTGGGMNVQFGVGLKTTPFIHIPQSPDFTTRSIALDSLGLAQADLADVHVLFTVVTNDIKAPNGGTVLLDNIRFEPVPTAQQSALGLPLSTETFGVIPRQAIGAGRVTIPPDQVNRNPSATYESTMALTALLRRGTPQELDAARLIADTLHYALSHDTHGDALPPGPVGSAGVHSGYRGGDIALRNDQYPPATGRSGDIRLAGFSAGKTACGPTGTCLMLDGATGGNAALAAVGLVAMYLDPRVSDPRYLDDARALGHWIAGNLADTSPTGFGGYFLGYPDGGVAKDLIKTKSIENNADIYAAMTALANAERQLGNSAQADSWTSQANVAGDFVMAMFDSSSGCFFGGTTPSGTAPIPGIDPTGTSKGNDVVNVYPYLDSESFTIMSLAGSGRYATSIDWHRPVRCMLNRFAQSVTVAGQPFRGFTLTRAPTAGPNGVAWEFTGQVVVAMQLVGQMYHDHAFDQDIAAFLHEIRHAQMSSAYGDGKGLVATTIQDGDQLPPGEQCLSTPWQCIPARVGLAATTWAIFADLNINPMLAACDPRRMHCS